MGNKNMKNNNTGSILPKNQKYIQLILNNDHQNNQESLRITKNHKESQRITQNHTESHRITQNHTESQRITKNHKESQRITKNHTELQRINYSLSHPINKVLRIHMSNIKNLYFKNKVVL